MNITKQFLVRTGLNLPAGSSTQPPMTFQAGTNSTVFVNGSVEWDGYNLFVSEMSTAGTHNVGAVNGVTITPNLAASVRRTIAHIDSTMTGTVSTISSATGTSQETAMPVITDNVVIASAANQTTTGPFSGVYLPPTVIGRSVSLFNTSAYTVNVYPSLAVPSFTGSCSGTTVTVTSTSVLQPNMILSGSGVTSGTTIISILSATTFAVNVSQAFTNVTLSVTNTGQSKINNGAVNTGAFQINPNSSVAFTATTLTDWTTSSGAIGATNNNITGFSGTAGDVLLASNTTGGITGISDIETGNVLLSGGIGANPSYGKVGLTTHVSGTLAVANGGTGTTGSGLTASGTSYELLTTGVTSTINFGTAAAVINIGATATNITGNVVVSGMLTVNGGSTISNSAITTYADAIIELHTPTTGWQVSDDAKDIGFKFHNQKPGHSFVVTQIVGDGSSAVLTLGDSALAIPIGTLIIISGASFSTYAGTYRVTATNNGTVTVASVLATTINGVGAIQVVTTLSASGGTSTGSAMTISYTGPAIAAGDIVTLYNAVPSAYNGTWTVATASVGSFTVTTNSTTGVSPLNIGPTTNSPIVVLGNRYAFTGYTSDSSSFEFYEESYEVNNQIRGAYGTIKAGSLSLSQSSSVAQTELASGSSISIPARTIYDTSTAESTTVTQGSVINVSQTAIGALNTAVTYTNLASLYIAAAPTSASNLTITNAYALQIAAGDTLMGGNLAINGGTISSAASTVNVFNTTTTQANMFGTVQQLYIANDTTAARTINIATNATSASTMKFGGGITSGTNKIIIGGGSGGTVVFDSFNSDSTAQLFPSSTTGIVKLAENAANVTLQNLTSTTATTLNIATSTGATYNSTLTYGGAVTTATNKIIINSGAAGTATLDTAATSATVNIFPTTTTGIMTLASAGRIVNISTGTTAAATLTFGTAGYDNTFKMQSTTAGTINLTTDVTTGAVNLYTSVTTGVITLGGTYSSGTSGNVKLGSSPSQSAVGTEVVTAAWVLASAAAGSPGSVSTDTANGVTLQVIDDTSSGLGAFLTSTCRAAKYVIQATQIGTTSTRTQTSELMISHDAPFTTLTGATASGTTLTVVSNAGLYVGMTLEFATRSGSDTINSSATGTTTITGISATTITLAASATITTSSLMAYIANPNFSITITAANNTSTFLFSGTSTMVGVLYPGMMIAGAGVAANTYVTAINTSTGQVTLSQVLATGAGVAITGTIGIYMTEYAILETNGTIAVYSPSINASSPYNIQMSATPLTTVSNTALALGTLVKTIFRIEKQMIKLM